MVAVSSAQVSDLLATGGKKYECILFIRQTGSRTPFPSSTVSLPDWWCAVTALELLAGSSSEYSG